MYTTKKWSSKRQPVKVGAEIETETMKENEMKKLFEKFNNAGYLAKWGEYWDEIELYLSDADFYISKSAANYYSIKKVPYFTEKEFYAVKTIKEVFDIIEK